MKNSKKNFLRIFLILLIIGILQLSCNGVSSTDERLQEPINAMTDEFQKLIKQIKVLVGVDILAPWITTPVDQLFNAETEILLKGWIPNTDEADLVIYTVDPDPSLSSVNNTIKELARINVNEETTEWEVTVSLPDENQYLAARIEKQLGITSPFSNIIYVSKGTPDNLIITSPEQNQIVTSDITLQGTGEPQLDLILWINGEKTSFTTKIEDDGSWQITGVPLVVAGFDKDHPNEDINKNILMVSSEATDQKAQITIRRVEPIAMLWPFGKGDPAKEEIFQPDLSIGKVTAFFNNDWHKYSFSISTDKKIITRMNSNHYAMDISTGTLNQPIHSVADGTVVSVGKASYGNYLIVDYGGWGVLYLHIVETPSNSKVKIGDKVKAGQIIATEGGSYNFPVHLHLAVCIFDPLDDRSSISNFFDKRKVVNINPPKNIINTSKFNNIDLYDQWGGNDLCLEEGCWSFKWDKEYPTLRYSVSSKYAEGCYKDYIMTIDQSLSFEKQIEQAKKINNFFSGLSRRAIYCLSNKDNCPCDE